MIYRKVKYPMGKRNVFFLGKKIFSYTVHSSKLNPEFYWSEIWVKYILKNDIPKLSSELKKDLDRDSIEYIDTFLYYTNLLSLKKNETLPYRFGWTKGDEKCFERMYRNDKSVHFDITQNFMHDNIYGLYDIYDEIKDYIKDKTIIDGGALYGDTALLFNDYFPNSNIYSFEPVESSYIKLQECIDEKNLTEKIIPLKMGLGNAKENLKIVGNGGGASFAYTPNDDNWEEVAVETIDNIANEYNLEIGLIKLDVEGFEKKALEGAKEIIKRDKPVIIAAIYHNPVDFFEIRPMLEELRPDYKFMVRRSEAVIALGDIVLIAY